MVAKGHNHGLCRKCGKVHVNGMKNKKHSPKTRRKMRLAHKGRPKATLETRKKIGKNRKIALKNGANHGWKGHNWGLCRYCGKNHGEPPAKGKPKSEETRRKIGLGHKGVKETLKVRLANCLGQLRYRSRLTFVERERIRERHRKFWRIMSPEEYARRCEHLRQCRLVKHIARVREFYKIPKGEVFFPSSLYDHKFTREVLIEKTKCHSYYEHNGLLEHSCYYNKNGELKVIQGLFMRGENVENLLSQFHSEAPVVI